MHGLIFETSVWLLAESTRLLSSHIELEFLDSHNTLSHFQTSSNAKDYENPTKSNIDRKRDQAPAPPTNQFTKWRKRKCFRFDILVQTKTHPQLFHLPQTDLLKPTWTYPGSSSPETQSILFSRQYAVQIQVETTGIGTGTGTELDSGTPSGQQTSFHAQYSRKSLHRKRQLGEVHLHQVRFFQNERPRLSSTTQHCTNRSKDSVTQRETANQHPTKKRTLNSKTGVANIGKTVGRHLWCNRNPLESTFTVSPYHHRPRFTRD